MNLNNFLYSSYFLEKKESLNNPLTRIKYGIWLYFLLIIFEGALRKWVFPDLATPLLIVRDPIALWLLFSAYKNNIFRINSYIVGMWIISVASFCTAIFFGHGNLYVALFGVRILSLHFPLIFIIGQVFDKQDVHKIGRSLLWIVVPMTCLMVLQFYSPQSAWVNRGLSLNAEGGGFSGALGFFRPPGTFSFISGLTQFYGLAAAFIFYFWLDDSKIMRTWILIISTICLAISIPFSISRTLFFEVIISFAFAVVVAIQKPKYLSRFIVILIIGMILIIAFSNFGFTQTGLEVFITRFESANEAEGGAQGVIIGRFLGGMTEAILNSDNIPFWGFGTGMGTNAGAMLLTNSADTFLISEGEWGRLIGEMGLLIGIVTILLRMFLSVKILINSIQAFAIHNFLPWMLLSFGFLMMIQGPWGQPTSLGFSILTGGLILASFKIYRKKMFRNDRVVN